MQPHDFAKTFQILTGVPPFPWQTALYARFINDDFPATATLPTGLGKTSIIAVWLCALATKPASIPRRLVYVVNRRTVVDQTTAEVEKWRDNLEAAGLHAPLASLCAVPLSADDTSPLAISTLRGQFADNRAWSADPARPAVIVGTVDMIGSGLLFSRYTVGFKLRPHHAALLAHDALIIHDEAHLEPAFQKLLESIIAEQNTSADPRKLRAIALTATSRTTTSITYPRKPFGLDENANAKDSDNDIVNKRINATKRLSLVALGANEKLDAALVTLAKQKTTGRAVLVFARSVETVLKIATELDKGETKGKVATLTGTMRGQERDNLVAGSPDKPDAIPSAPTRVFQRFLPKKDRAEGIEPATGTVFLVATSAGEVGVNLSADDLVCDLSTYESMAQRFGRVNRFGDRDDSTITVVHETEFESAKQPLEAARERTLALLRKLNDDASPAALGKLNETLSASERDAAFSPLPAMRTATAVQFDAWALTTIRESLSARPPVAPYLHGEAEWQPPETHLAWRDDLDFRHIDAPEDFLEKFPLRPRELLRDTSKRIAQKLEKLLQPETDLPDAWLVSDDGVVHPFPLRNFDKDRAEPVLANAILILPKSVGGLENGLFTDKAQGVAADVSGIIRIEAESRDAIPQQAKLRHSAEISEEGSDEPRYLLWCENTADPGSGSSSKRLSDTENPDTLAAHTRAVEDHARAIAGKLLSAPAPGEPDLRHCLVLAASLHDLGKNRARWQRNLGDRRSLGIPDYDPARPETILAKSTPRMRPRKVAEHYRHEFGSLHDAACESGLSTALAALDDLERDIVLHLAAAHHGRARPHFPKDEIFDYHPATNPVESAKLATEIPRRFARLQRRFGRWGLAWLESLLRAADYAASAGIVPQSSPPTAVEIGKPETTAPSPGALPPTPTATLDVNSTNPGHFFACCGLFELAACPAVSPDALAWFEEDPATRQWRFHLSNTPPLGILLEKITGAEITALDPDDATASPIMIGPPFNVRVDWWKTADTKTSALKVWAGTMEAPRITRAMQKAVRPEEGEKLLFDLRIAYAPDDPTKKVEPFYFDANRGPNSDARDVGFSTNDLSLETLAAPAVEFLTLVGLQRAIPQPAGDRLFDYHLWQTPVPIALLAAAANGLTEPRTHSFRFESWYRTSQRKHKAFLTAKPL